MGVRRPADALAHPDLALQREGPLGARAQGRRLPAPSPPAALAHGGRARPDAREDEDLPGPRARRRADRRLDGDHRGDRGPLPRPPLYPGAAAERRRALELEEWFDEQLGPHIRLLAWHEITHDQDRLEALVGRGLPGPAKRLAAGVARTFVNLRFGVRSAEAAGEARERVRTALERLEQDLGESDYLVGDRFTVADLTAAALFYPLVLPPEGPKLPDPPEPLERFRASLKERRGYRWVAEIFRRHRQPG